MDGEWRNCPVCHQYDHTSWHRCKDEWECAMDGEKQIGRRARSAIEPSLLPVAANVDLGSLSAFAPALDGMGRRTDYLQPFGNSELAGVSAVVVGHGGVLHHAF